MYNATSMTLCSLFLYDVTLTMISVLQVKMLKALGLQSTLITDGSSPINLFNTAHGLIGGALNSSGPPAMLQTPVDDD